MKSSPDRGGLDRKHGPWILKPRIAARRIYGWILLVGRDIVLEEDMTESEIEAYMEGWRNEEDRKDWG